MKITSHFNAILLVLVFVPASWSFAESKSENVPAKPAAVENPKAKPIAKIIKKQVKGGKKAKVGKKKPEGFVIGKNLKVGMNLSKVFALLGVPQKIKVQRGTEPSLDSISVEYAKHGVVVHALNGKQKVEAIELLPAFKGQFTNGIKMGDKVPTLIKKNGVPHSMNANLARYPDKGLYFSLRENALVSARIFAKNSKILIHQLHKPR